MKRGMSDNASRREFIKLALASSLSTGGATLSSVVQAQESFAPLNRRVAINVYLTGGPDWRHVFPPAYSANTSSYGNLYWKNRARAHGIARSESAAQRRWDDDFHHTVGGRTRFGILKRCGWLYDMWNQGNVAIISNTVGAVSRDHSHAISVMNLGDIDAEPRATGSGWGGRLAHAAGGTVVSLTNTPSTFCFGADPSAPLDLSRFDNSNLISARDSRHMTLHTHDETRKPAYFDSRDHAARGLHTYYEMKTREMNPESPFFQFVEHYRKLKEFGERIDQRLAGVPLPAPLQKLANHQQNGLENPAFGLQMRNVYDMFVCSDIVNLNAASLEYSNWDSHKGQRAQIEPQLEDLFGRGKSMDVLFRELPNDVRANTVFVFSGDFGRQLKDNGANGTDHGRGTAVVLVGDSVRGGLYGEMFPDAEIDRQDDPGPDIEGQTEIDHVFGAVCDWVQPNSKGRVFPKHGSRILEPDVNLDRLLS